MYVLFRLERVEGIAPVVDEYVDESVISVDVRYAQQIQSTDEYAVPTRSKRVQLETRTQLLWNAPAEGAPGTLELEVYQDWPGARQAHPLRACLGWCTLQLPATTGGSHAAIDVRAALETTTHPLATAADWPAPVAYGVVEVSWLRPTAAAQPRESGHAALPEPAAVATAAPSHALPRVASLIRQQPYSTQNKPPRPASAVAAAHPAPRETARPAVASPRPTSAPPLPAPRAAKAGRGPYVSQFPPSSSSEADLLAAAHAAAQVDWLQADFTRGLGRDARDARRDERDARRDGPPHPAEPTEAVTSLGASAAEAPSHGRSARQLPFAFDSEAHIQMTPPHGSEPARGREQPIALRTAPAQLPSQPLSARMPAQTGTAAVRTHVPLPAPSSHAPVACGGHSDGGLSVGGLGAAGEPGAVGGLGAASGLGANAFFAFGSGSTVDAIAAGLAHAPRPEQTTPAESTHVRRELAELQDAVAIARVGLWSKSPPPYAAAAATAPASRRPEPWRPTTSVRRAATDRPLAESGSEFPLPTDARGARHQRASSTRARARPRSARAAPEAARRGAAARSDASQSGGEMAAKLAQLERRIAKALISCDQELELKSGKPATAGAMASKAKSPPTPRAAVPRKPWRPWTSLNSAATTTDE